MNASGNLSAFERKFAPVDFKKVDEQGSFEGYACLFNERDMGSDVVMPGAFRKSLQKRGASTIRMLFQHDVNEPIGVWRIIREDGKGLYVQGKLLNEVGRAREILSLMRAGALDGLSIGFRTQKARHDRAGGVRRLYEVDLWEISVVTFPMQPNARIRQVKAGCLPTEREFERWLVRDAGFTRAKARAIIRSGYKSLARKQDAAGKDRERLIGVLRRAAGRFKS